MRTATARPSKSGDSTAKDRHATVRSNAPLTKPAESTELRLLDMQQWQTGDRLDMQARPRDLDQPR